MDKKKAVKKTTAKKPNPNAKWKTTGGASVAVDLSKVEFVNKPTSK